MGSTEEEEVALGMAKGGCLGPLFWSCACSTARNWCVMSVTENSPSCPRPGEKITVIDDSNEEWWRVRRTARAEVG